MNKRSNIEDIKTGAELVRWYWLKEELVAFCKLTGINYTGVKFDILKRIAAILDEKPFEKGQKVKMHSNFNWHSEQLTLETLITDSYKNTQNVRRFFQEHCNKKFSFNIAFMVWMKANAGKTLQDGVEEWNSLNAQTKSKNFKTEIPKGNQYNQYLRDFFIDNPNKTIKEARHFWALKRALPLEFHRYDRSDLNLK